MALINFARREIEAKVVYYGPAMSGKTTNLEALHGVVPEGQRGDLHQLQTEDERTIYFDYVPVSLGQIAGFTAKFKLFTVPGQVFYKETRRVLLQGADAVVFVADSSPDRAAANIDSLVDLEENLRAQGLDLASIPLVIQLNKRDVVGARAPDDLATDLNPFGVPMVEAIAFQGNGVLETLRTVTDIAGARIRENLAGKQTAVALTAVARPSEEDDRKVVHTHVEQIRKVRPKETERGQQMRADGEVDPEAIDAFLLENVERGELDAIPGPVLPRKVTPPPPRPAGPVAVAGDHEVAFKRPVPKPPPAPTITPTPPSASPPPPVARNAAGPPLQCNFDAVNLAGLRVVELKNGVIGPDGRISITLTSNNGGTLRDHPLTLVPTPPPPKKSATLPALTAALIAGGVGLLFGMLVTWVAFQG